ncbi:MAG: PorT family protein [Candidatus Latescibacteria bacterium]|nr:PorT family protein [Candidatus Latescibacterota bacterium]
MNHLSRYIIASVIALTTINFPAPVPAQTTLAIRGGLSRATMSGIEDLEDTALKARTGLSIGASATIPIQDNFSLRLDGGYVQKGYSAEATGLEANLFLDYIELSGLGAVNLTPSGSPASAHLLIGPSFAFKTGCEASATVSLGGETSNVSESCGDNVRGIDLGITGGVGAEMAVSEQMSLSVDLRYTLGLLSVDATGDDDIKNRNLTLQVGVGFPIGE